MNPTTNNQDIKRLIKQELPGLMKKDRKIREWIRQLTKEQLTEKANEIETKTESKFDRLLEELKRDREEQARKWDELKMDLQRDREEQNKKWAEQNKKWEEQNKKWDEYNKKQDKKWAEQNKKWEEQNKKWDEYNKKQDKKWAEQNKKWEEQNKKWDEQNKKWEENQKEIRKLYDALEKHRKDSNRRYNTTVGALGARWGLRSESSFRNALKGILADLDLRVEHIDDYDEEGMVYGQPSSVEIDIIIKNGLLMICELKSSISKADMFTFYKKTLFYEKKYHRRGDRLIVISPMVEIKAREAAEQLGIKVYSYAADIQEEL